MPGRFAPIIALMLALSGCLGNSSEQLPAVPTLAVPGEVAACLAVRTLAAEHVPSLVSGQMRIERCARVAGYRTKVVVDGIGGVEAIVGPQAQYINALSEALGEPVDVIPASHEPERLLASAFAPRTVKRVVLGNPLVAVLLDEHVDTLRQEDIALVANILQVPVDVVRLSVDDAWRHDGRTAWDTLGLDSEVVTRLVLAGYLWPIDALEEDAETLNMNALLMPQEGTAVRQALAAVPRERLAPASKSDGPSPERWGG